MPAVDLDSMPCEKKNITNIPASELVSTEQNDRKY